MRNALLSLHPSSTNLLSNLSRLAQSSSRKPLSLGCKPPRRNPRNCNRQKDDGRVIERLRRDRPLDGRKQHGSEIQVPDHSDEAEGTGEATQGPFGVVKLIGSDEDAAEAYEGVGCDCGDAGGADEGCEGDGRGQDCAEEESGDGVHGHDGVARFSVAGDFADPA